MLRVWTGTNGYHEALDNFPGAFDSVDFHVILQIHTDSLSSLAQSNLAQRRQITLAEKIALGRLRTLGSVNFAFCQALEQRLRWQIHQLDLVGTIHDAVRNGFVHGYAGNLPDGVDQAFYMLHVQSGINVDTMIEQLQYVLVALAVARTFDVGVRQLIDQNIVGLQAQNGVQIHVFQLDATVFEF